MTLQQRGQSIDFKAIVDLITGTARHRFIALLVNGNFPPKADRSNQLNKCGLGRRRSAGNLQPRAAVR